MTMLIYSYLILILNCTFYLSAVAAHQLLPYQFTNDSYTGYLSENIAVQSSSQQSPASTQIIDQYKRRNLNEYKKFIYIRFVDEPKPSITSGTLNSTECNTLHPDDLNLTLKTSEYDQDTKNLFELDSNPLICTFNQLLNLCMCFIKLRLTDDPFVQDRINREAKDSYQFQLRANQASATIIVNILDDNDLEPMFDPSEYIIDLNQFDSDLNQVNLPQFSVIGRVWASDPDLGQNARVRFYSGFDPYFGVNSQSGEIYLKQSLDFLFKLNKTEFNFEIKAIDSGTKLNLVNNLLKSMSIEQKIGLSQLESKFVQAGLKHVPVKGQSNSQASFESAQVKISLNKNLKSILNNITLEKIDFSLIDSKSSFYVPYKKIRFGDKKIKLDQVSIKIETDFMRNYLEFSIKKLKDSIYLLYFNADLDLDRIIRNETGIYKVFYYDTELLSFEFNFKDDLIESISSMCQIGIKVPKLIQVNKFSQLKSILTKPEFEFGSNLCNLIFSNENLFRMDLEISGENIVEFKSNQGILLKQLPAINYSFVLTPQVYFKFNGLENILSLNKTSSILNIEYSRKYDLIASILDNIEPVTIYIDQDNNQNTSDSKRVIYEAESNMSIFYCQMVKLDNSINPQECLFTISNNQLIFNSNSFQTYKFALVSLKNESKYSELLILNELATRIKLTTSSNKKSKKSDSNILDTPILIAQIASSQKINQQFQLNILDDQLDSKCFNIDQTSGQIYLKCKLPFTYLNKQNSPVKNLKNKISFGQTTLKRTLEVSTKEKSHKTRINVYFELSDQFKRLQDISLSLEPIFYNFLDYSVVQSKILDQIKKELKNNSKSYLNQAQIQFNNETFWTLIYKIQHSSDCKIDSVIWKFKSENPEEIYLFDLIEDNNDLFKLDKLTGELSFANEFRPVIWSSIYKYTIKINLTQTNLIYSQNKLITIEIEIKIDLNNLDLVQIPQLAKSNYHLKISRDKIEKSKDMLILDGFKFYPQNRILNFNSTYSIRQIQFSNEFPFYIDSQTGQLFYFNSVQTQNSYKFQVVCNIKFNLNEKLFQTRVANIQVDLTGSNSALAHVQLTSKEKSVISTFYLNVPVHSTELFMYLKTPLIGFLTLSDDICEKYNFDIFKPKFKLKIPEIQVQNKENRFRISNSGGKKKNKKVVSKRATAAQDTYETNLINENFLTMLSVDEQTGGLYFNQEQESNLNTFSRMARLINYFYYERNQSSKFVRLDAQITNELFNISQFYWINLIFHQNEQNLIMDKKEILPEVHKNNFKINSNNLLNMFRNGDEFLLDIEIEENSPTWLSLIDSSQQEEGIIINLREYFISKLNQDKKNQIVYLNILKNIRFYMLDKNQDSYFKIEDNLNGILLTKQSIQFDYEISRFYLAKVLVVQYLPESNDLNDFTELENSSQDDLVFEQKHKEKENTFFYYLDLNIRVGNLVDEPFVCSEPVYYLNVDENEIKNKKLFTIPLQDYDQGQNVLDESKYQAQILSGNAQGLFHINGISLYTGSSTRKLDRETRAHHELEVKVFESNEFNSSRFALCKIIITVNDINDNRPIVNDLELSIYDKLDAKLVEDLKIPIANAIAIDQDQFAKLTYSIVSIKLLDSQTMGRRRVRSVEYEDSIETKSDDELTKSFHLNTTTGSLYSTRIEMPCSDCIIQIVYKASDVGRFKTRVSRKSTIKLNVKKYPISLFKLNENGPPQVEKLSNTKTFDLAFKPNKSVNIVVLTLNEDIKLGEKIYQLKTKSRVIIEKSIIYYHLLESTNLNQTFYLSNSDGSLYLIKPLDYDQEVENRVFNLTVLITNWIGQIEYVHIEIYVKDTNDNRPRFGLSVFDLEETIQMDLLGQIEKQIDLVKAVDLDELDLGKLSFKLEDCFYIGSNILLKKPYVPSAGVNPSTNYLNYPLCSKQFIELVWSPSETNSQIVRLKMNLNEFIEYLKNSSDYYQSIGKVNQSILFLMDLSVKDSSLGSPGLTRIRLNLKLEQQNKLESNLVFNNRNLRELNPKPSKKFGFKRENYFVSIKSKNDFQLIRLFNEFVWLDSENSVLSSFKPFDLKFYIKNSNLVSVEPNFGTLYLNQTHLEDFIFEIEVFCKIKHGLGFGKYNPNDNKLFKSTKVIISVLKTALVEQINLDDLQSLSIWQKNQILGYLPENVQLGTGVKQTPFGQEEIFINKYLNSDMDKSYFNFKIKSPLNELFDLEPRTGLIRVKFEPDFEIAKIYSLDLIACMQNLDSKFGFKNSSLCFDQTLNVQVVILNRNDNEPRFKLLAENEYHLNLSNPSELLRSMTLFKFEILDLDAGLNKLKIDLVQVNPDKSSNHNCHNFNELTLDSFSLFELPGDSNNFGVKLTDFGFDSLLIALGKHNFDEKCIQKVEIMCRITDGLFSNQINLILNIESEPSTDLPKPSSYLSFKNNLIAPILHTIELTEANKTNSEVLINIEELLINYLGSNLNSKNLEKNFNFELGLLNYENLFFINQTSKQLVLRPGILDREQRDSFELFISVLNLNLKNKHLIPSRIRILIKLTDINDNRPIFVRPSDAKYTKKSEENFDLYFYNRTYLWSNLIIESNEMSPILTVEAIDLDLGRNSELSYFINSSSASLFSINQQTGSIYFNQRLTVPVILPIVELSIVARDHGKPVSLESYLIIRFHFLETKESSLYFEQTFYQFKIVESFDVNKTIGHINSAKLFNSSVSSNIIYSIVDGDEFQEFKIDYKTGRLSPRTRLDFETKSSYILTIKATNGVNSTVDQYSNATVRIELIDINDQEPKFESFEYEIRVNENLAKMSEIFRLNATDSDSKGSPNSQIRYKLLNHLDLFYVHEETGIVYNKQSFDYELGPRSYQLKIKAYDLGNINENQTFVSKSLETSCLLTIYILNSNDNTPEFEKAVYFTQLEIDLANTKDSREIREILLDSSSSKTANSSFQFVTKINAKDTDSNELEYSILKQTLLIEHTSAQNQLVQDNLFSIEPQTGLVILNIEKFNLFKKFSEFSNPELRQSQVYTFNLELLASDSKFTAQTRLNIQVKVPIQSARPVFTTNLVKINLNTNQTSLLDLNELLETSSLNKQVQFTINLEQNSKFLDFFQIEGSSLKLNRNNLNSLDAYSLIQIPVLACDRQQTGLCDQVLILVLVESKLKPVLELPSSDIFMEKAKKIGFAYNYGVFTIQQQFGQSPDYQYMLAEPVDEEDYYSDESFESNERFYFEIKTLDLSNDLDEEDFNEDEDLDRKTTGKSNKTYKYEFDIFSCSYTNLNISLSNTSLIKQIKQFTQSKSYFQLSSQQIKSLFLLNKHNGVLSSRKIINLMAPGLYTFNITFKLLNKLKQNQSIQIDSTLFKLLILPSSSSIRNNSKHLNNNFKFDKEFYKFKFQPNKTLGQIRLQNKYQKSKQSNVKYELIKNKFNNDFFSLESSSGELKAINNLDLDLIQENLNEDNELVLYALAIVKAEKSNSNLEYMIEIHVDFNQFLSEQKIRPLKNLVGTQDGLSFGKENFKVRLNENLPLGSVIYRFIALTSSNQIDQRDLIVYKLENLQELFLLDSFNGVLSLQKELNKLEHLVLNITACIESTCCSSQISFELFDVNNQAPEFDSKIQEGSIREDALPGTVVATLNSKDQDGSRPEYFILNGDRLNQFAISSDGKVYTRLMLDKEQIENYSLFLIAYDGKYKAVTRLNIKVLNVDDTRPICEENLVNLSLSENLKVGHVYYKVKAINQETESNLKYELMSYDQVEGFTRQIYDILPFGINEHTGEVQLTDLIDFEYKKNYKFYVRVFKSNDQFDLSSNRVLKTSNGLEWTRYCLVKFNIQILDENDNRPEFRLNEFNSQLIVQENSPKGTLLDAYEAVDLDSKLNSRVRFSIVNNDQNLSGLFRINPLNGLISLESNKLDREKLGDLIKLRIRASNLDGLASEFDLPIRITDLNDNKPKFQREEYFLSIQENLPLGFVITELRAQDPDLNSTTEYLMLPGQSSKFLIDRKTGKVSLNGSIDYEEQNQYILDVIALDPELEGDNSCLTRLIIDIIDLNDNPPVFDPSTPSDIYLNENTPINSTIFTLSAFDSDKTNSNNKLSFRVLEGSDYFGIDQHSGKLFNKIEFDYELVENKTLHAKIECSDNANKDPLRAEIDLNIHIQDLNDNEPIFQRKNQTLIFKDSYPLGQEITRFNVTDADSFNQDPKSFTFVLVEQYKQIDNGLTVHLTEPIFSINPNGSLILIKRPLSNQVYYVKLRCYDTGLPAPLYSDTYLTIKVTDESNNEPKMSDYIFDVITGENSIFLKSDQIIGELKASDLDKQDSLFYDLNDSIFELNKLNGLLKTKKIIAQSASFSLRPSVTDKKFITESNLQINVKEVKADCLLNSLYAKFSILANQSIGLDKFIRIGYLKKFQENIYRLLLSQFKTANNLTVQVIGLRQVESGHKEDELGFESQEYLAENTSPTIIEILFNVHRDQSNNKLVECLSSKYVSKVLNRKKQVLIKRLKIGQAKLKLADLSFNHECERSISRNTLAICSTNVALQNCQLRFTGYNQHDLCERQDQTQTRCQLIPKYEWTCEALDGRKAEPKESQEKPSIEIVESTSTTRASTEKFGFACKKNMNPCKNNGICKLIRGGNKKSNGTRTRLHCFCPNGFKGKHCEEDINECVDSEDTAWVNPCHPSAKCINTNGAYICNCSMQPSSLCYNQLSPQYSASIADQKDFQTNLKYLNSIRKFNYLNDQDDYVELDESDFVHRETSDEYTAHITLFGMKIPTQVIQQALLGIFGGICAILVLLSLAAGIVCKINLSRSYSSSNSLHHRHDKLDSTIGGCVNTSNTSVDHDVFSSSTSSPCSYKMGVNKSTNRGRTPNQSKVVQNSNKYKNNRFIRNKQRSSMTTSLLSSNTCESASETQNQASKTNRKNFKYILFSKFNSKLNEPMDPASKVITLSTQESSSLAEIETSSAYSPQSLENGVNNISLSKYKVSKKQNLSVVESSCLLEASEQNKTDANDADDEDYFNKEKMQGLIRPVNIGLLVTANTDSLSSFGRSSFKQKYNTLNVRPSSSTIDIDKVKFNTALNTKKIQALNNQQHSTFLPTPLPNNLNENLDKDESINTNEDCSLGFYWDVTDWAGGIGAINSNEMQKLNNNQTINTEPVEIQIEANEFVNQNEHDFSPIYSKVFKVNSKSKMEKMDELAVSSIKLDNDSILHQTNDLILGPEEDEVDDEEDINKKLNSFQTNNYLYLINKEDCDKTIESTTTTTNAANNTFSQMNDDESNHYFMPFFKTDL